MPNEIRDKIRRAAFKQGRVSAMRQNPSDAERYMWNLLRGRRLAGFRFRRQQPIGPYIVDFYCAAAKLIIEMDGNQHAGVEHEAKDEDRTRWLTAHGYRVVRIWNNDFMRSQQDAADYIARLVVESVGPHPEIRFANFDPPSKGG